jgi:hypothetical protein
LNINNTEYNVIDVIEDINKISKVKTVLIKITNDIRKDLFVKFRDDKPNYWIQTIDEDNEMEMNYTKNPIYLIRNTNLGGNIQKNKTRKNKTRKNKKRKNMRKKSNKKR